MRHRLMAAWHPGDDWRPSWRTDPVHEAFDVEERGDAYAAEREAVLYPVADDKRIGWQKEREA